MLIWELVDRSPLVASLFYFFFNFFFLVFPKAVHGLLDTAKRSALSKEDLLGSRHLID